MQSKERAQNSEFFLLMAVRYKMSYYTGYPAKCISISSSTSSSIIPNEMSQLFLCCDKITRKHDLTRKSMFISTTISTNDKIMLQNSDSRFWYDLTKILTPQLKTHLKQYYLPPLNLNFVVDLVKLKVEKLKALR